MDLNIRQGKKTCCNIARHRLQRLTNEPHNKQRSNTWQQFKIYRPKRIGLDTSAVEQLSTNLRSAN